jgi:hypothetical protein
VRAEEEFEATLKELRALVAEAEGDPEAAARRQTKIEQLTRRLDELAETVELA